MTNVETISATEFKAKCLEVLDRLACHQVERVTVTKHGRAVAVLTPPPPDSVQVAKLYGFMRDSIVLTPDLDLTQPIFEGEFEAENGSSFE